MNQTFTTHNQFAFSDQFDKSLDKLNEETVLYENTKEFVERYSDLDESKYSQAYLEIKPFDFESVQIQPLLLSKFKK